MRAGRGSFIVGDKVRWGAHTWRVTSVWDTNCEGWRANLKRRLSDAAYELRSVPVNECEKVSGLGAPGSAR